ncbi:mandelate racemase/muconate lactonizing enzyme family protein [Mesorhizobium sp. VK9D]|uniref:mandelate racemase/muconate lactonizing enzyme family protein n=1 Tax=Mesorhizobium australafricanum TaxID=3072311 RepID=UPI002A24AF49|nr:mandelate racemase/muconate lactonizing enzyme family protein [Mesorhizobium sp. VK9D]MDX8452333.1 mandelate racemase/muconate lactonizing enzyme family protein [Mesorhizobium sp. VK9D]
MRITRVRFTLCGYELATPIPLACGRLTHRNFGIVTVETDAGLTGIGETSVNFPPWCVHERRATIEDGLAGLLIGENPLDIDRLWRKMVEATRAFTRMWAEGAIMQAISGIDIALWDLAGKHFGMPVWQLLGRRYREEIECYAVGFSAVDPAAGALEMQRKGYRHAKMRIGFNDAEDIAKACAMRDAVGAGFGMMIDANQAFDLPRARTMLRELEPLSLSWLEEPLLTDDLDGYRRLREEFPALPLAWGENAFALSDYRDFLGADAVQFVMPDPCRSGGFTQATRMCEAADELGIPFSPHHYGSDIGFVAALHLAASRPNFSIMLRDEAPVPLRGDLLAQPVVVDNGKVRLPEGPGLGVELNERVVRSSTIPLG